MFYSSLFLYNSQVSSILNQNEKIFFQGLKKYLRNRNLNICPKVRLNDIIKVDDNLSEKQKRYINHKTFPKHLDFVIIDDNGNIKCVIELDGDNHKEDKMTILSDKMKREICIQLGIELINIPNAKKYDYTIIDAKISDYI